jgi:hypothetical protein
MNNKRKKMGKELRMQSREGVNIKKYLMYSPLSRKHLFYFWWFWV